MVGCGGFFCVCVCLPWEEWVGALRPAPRVCQGVGGRADSARTCDKHSPLHPQSTCAWLSSASKPDNWVRAQHPPRTGKKPCLFAAEWVYKGQPGGWLTRACSLLADAQHGPFSSPHALATSWALAITAAASVRGMGMGTLLGYGGGGVCLGEVGVCTCLSMHAHLVAKVECQPPTLVCQNLSYPRTADENLNFDYTHGCEIWKV